MRILKLLFAALCLLAVVLGTLHCINQENRLHGSQTTTAKLLRFADYQITTPCAVYYCDGLVETDTGWYCDSYWVETTEAGKWELITSRVYFGLNTTITSTGR